MLNAYAWDGADINRQGTAMLGSNDPAVIQQGVELLTYWSKEWHGYDRVRAGNGYYY